MSLDTYCVMGNPVEHSRSPWIHSRFAELTGRPCVRAPLVPLDGFGAGRAHFAQAGGRGCNITVPFKLEAAQAATRSERVQLAGAANTLVFEDGAIHADNTDGLGLVADISNAGVPLAGRDVLLSARAAPPPGCWARCWRRPAPRGGQPHAARAQALVQPMRPCSATKQSC
jgi:shikimate dehydrogenase